MIQGSSIRVSGTRLPSALILAFGLVLTPLVHAATAQTAGPAPAGGEVSPEQVKALILTLENPAQREKLIAQLKALVHVQERAAPESAVKTATGQLLQALSGRITSVGRQVLEIAGSINEFPRLLTWGRQQFSDRHARQLWGQVLTNLALVLGIGYLAFFLFRAFLARPYRALAGRKPETPVRRLSLLLLRLWLDLVPIAAFALGAYITLGLHEPRAQVRLVALAWINASIIVRLALALGRFVFAPTASALRILPVSDETAHYADIWVRRLAFMPVYSYFALQAALLLGLPSAAYEALMRLLGLLVLSLVTVLIFQNRHPVAHYIRGPERAGRFRLGALRKRLAGSWHVIATLYVVLLYGMWALDVPGGFLFVSKATALTAVAVLVGRIVDRFLERFLGGEFHVSEDLKARFPGLEARANRYMPVVRGTVRVSVYAVVVLAVMEAWGINTFGWLASEPGRVLSATAVTVFMIVVVSIAIWELASSLIEGYLAEHDRFGRARVRTARTRTLLTVARNGLLIVLTIISSLLVLSELGVNITPLLAGAGVVGLAVGFGSQKLVQDLITGAFILFEDLFAVGDVIKVGDQAGVVERMSIRNVRLRDLSGTVHTIPFSGISTVSNLTKDFSYYLFDVGVAYREDVDEVMEVLRAIGQEMQQEPDYRRLILEPLEILGVDTFADSAVIIKARIKTLPIKQWTVGREFNRRMKKRFDELGIEIPFPHTTLYFGEDKKGKAPAARVAFTTSAAAATEAVSVSALDPAPAAQHEAEHRS
jgi:moderate conductance mechanosensitive channel